MASADTSLDETGTKIVLSGTNGELAENLDNSAQLKKEIPTENEVNSKEPNGSPEPKVKLSSEDYLEKFKLNILFEELIFRTLDNTPENPLKFLMTNLETMERDNWEPGESKAEKSEAVTKLFKIPESEPVTGKPNPKSTGRPTTGTATKGPVNPKVGTTQVKPAVKTTPPRPGVTSKTVSGKATPVRPAAVKTAPKITTTPAKIIAPSTAKVGTTGPARTGTIGAKTGVTGAAGKTGTSSVAPAKPGTTVGKPGVKTGSNPAVNKPGASRPTSAPAHTKTAVKTPATKPPPKSAAPRTTSSGTRTNKGPVIPKTGAALTKGKPPGAVAKTVSSGTDKSDKSEPVPKTPSPIEEAKAATPEEPLPPIDDGVCSKIPGNEDVTPQVLDSEELIALEEAQNISDDGDENINIVPKSLSVENLSNGSPIELEEVLVVVESQADRYITSQDYANDLQAIEDEVVHSRNSDDEGIEVNQELLSYPAVGLKTADELDNPGLYNLSLDPKGFSQLTQANVTIEVTDESGTKQTPDEILTVTNDLNEGDLVKEKSHDLEQNVLATEPCHVITPEETTQTDTREVKYSEDLGIDIEEQISPKDSPLLEQALEPIHSTTDQLLTVDTEVQPQVEPDSTMDEMRMVPTGYNVTRDILMAEANPLELIGTVVRESEPLMSDPLQGESDLLSGPIEKEHDLLSDPLQKQSEFLNNPFEKESDLLVNFQKGNYLLSDSLQKESEFSVNPFQTESDLLSDPFLKESDLLSDPYQKGNDLLVDPMPQKSPLDNAHSNMSNSPDSDEVPQTQMEPEPIFPASTGDV